MPGTAYGHFSPFCTRGMDKGRLSVKVERYLRNFQYIDFSTKPRKEGSRLQTEKQTILSHYEQSILWVKGLGELSEEQWRTPIKEGKWSVAEIIGHLIPWDAFILHDRIPYLFKDVDLPKGPDAQAVNDQAASESRERTKEETIEQFAGTRQALLSAINGMNDELWTTELVIGQSVLSLAAYFQGMIEHDNHHFEQIKTVM